MSIIEKAITWMENTARDNRHGYDQQYRWGERGDYDCSAAVITAWETAGVPVKEHGATYTGNILRAFKACGFSDVTGYVNRVTGSGLHRGDILLASGHHVAMYCGNGKEVEASINEKGKTRGGKPGDQTGKEFHIRNYRNYPWTNVLRYNEPVQTRVSVDQVARDCLAGKYGNGVSRKRNVEALGLNYEEVRNRVNELCGKTSAPKPASFDYDAIARDVLKGVYGNGKTRKAKITAMGADYEIVRKKVNALLKKR